MKKAEEEQRKVKKAKVTAIRLNVRTKPSIRADIIDHVSLGDEVEYFGVKKGEGCDGPADWLKIKGGYVMQEFTELL